MRVVLFKKLFLFGYTLRDIFVTYIMLTLRIVVVWIMCCSMRADSSDDDSPMGRSLYVESVTYKKKLDVLFVVDVSMSADVEALKNFIIRTTRVLELEAVKTKIAVLPLPFSENMKITLNEGIDHSAFIGLVKQRLKSGGLALFDLNGITQRITAMTNSGVGGRADAKKVVILVASSFPSLQVVISEMLALKNQNYRFFVVGLTYLAMAGETTLKTLVDDPNSDFIFLEKYSLLQTNKLNDALLKTFGRDPCIPNRCTNGKKCFPLSNGAASKCVCPPNAVCDSTDPCVPNPCNGGRCINPINNYIFCSCPDGREGDKCEKLGCTKNYCLHGGSCTKIKDQTLKCNCTSKFQGTRCESLISSSFCMKHPAVCQHSGTCVDEGGDRYTCKCVIPCSGTNCQYCSRSTSPTSDVCKLNPCKGKCVCYPSTRHEGGYFCKSLEGRLGKNCEIDSPTVSCLPTYMHVKIPQLVLPNSSTGSLSVGSSPNSTDSCKITDVSSGFYVINVALNKCGSTKSSLPGKITGVSNVVWIKKSTGQSYPVSTPLFKFSCRYGDDDYRAVTSLKPNLAISQTNTQEITMKPDAVLCSASVCPKACPEDSKISDRAVYSIGSDIHLSMSLLQAASQQAVTDVITVKKFYLSCSATSNVGSSVELIADGCPLNNGLNLLTAALSGLSNTACVTVKVLRLIACSEMYLHARLESCSATDRKVCTTNRSVYACSTPTGRRRKRSSETSSDIVIGPLIIVNTTGSSASLEIYNVEGSANFTVGNLIYEGEEFPIAPIAIGTTVLWSILLVVVALSLCLLLRLLNQRRW